MGTSASTAATVRERVCPDIMERLVYRTVISTIDFERVNLIGFLLAREPRLDRT